MNVWWLIPGIAIGGILTILVQYFTQKSSLQTSEKRAQTILAQATNRAQFVKEKASNEQAAQKALLASREQSDNEMIEEQQTKLAQREEKLNEIRGQIEEQRKSLNAERKLYQEQQDTYKRAQQQQTQALEKSAELDAKTAWQNYIDAYCLDETEAQQKRIEKVTIAMQDQVEEKAMAMMNVINQRYNGESTRDPTLIEIEFTAKEFERIVGDEQLTKIIHLQTSMGSELKLEYKEPHRVRVYGYDLWRRYIIKGALERMKKSIKMTLEQALDETQKYTEQRMARIGKSACDYLGIKDFPPELVKLVGRLDYRTSFGQNIYRHSIEVAMLGKMIAEEVGCDPYICIVGGLLHDIGKGVDADIAGAHDAIGRDIALQYHLHPDIVHSIFAHHEMEPYRSVEARVVQLADAISAARPGARHHEPLEEYIARMKALEEAALNQKGVEKAFVMQAGREIRAFVNAERTNDDGASAIAKLIVGAVQASNAVRSGEVKIQVIRELDVHAYAGRRSSRNNSYKAKR